MSLPLFVLWQQFRLPFFREGVEAFAAWISLPHLGLHYNAGFFLPETALGFSAIASGFVFRRCAVAR